jgi:glycosyltransferase involved in cell wall biosynthesis
VQTAPCATKTDDWPTITVVTPSYQQGNYLEETIRSVLLQNYPALEFVVVDGGSTDASTDILERYRPWLSFCRTAPDRGQAHALNLGFSLAGGTLRGWVNSDDFYLPGALRRVARHWHRTGVGVIYGDALELAQETGLRSLAPSHLAHPRYVKFPGLLPSHATFWTAPQHRPVWEEQHCSIDYELWIRLLPGARISHLPRPLAVARHHLAAKTFSPHLRQRWQEDAERNGQAHPDLYRPRPWLDFEFRLVQRFARLWRSRGTRTTLRHLCRECGWDRL